MGDHQFRPLCKYHDNFYVLLIKYFCLIKISTIYNRDLGNKYFVNVIIYNSLNIQTLVKSK